MTRPMLAHHRRWPVAALLAGSLLAACLAVAPSRAEALSSSSFCSPVGVMFCYRPEIVWGPSGPELNMFFNPGFALIHAWQ